MISRNSHLFRAGVAIVILALSTSGAVIAKNATGQNNDVTATAAAIESGIPGSFADIVAAVKPAVVNIAVKYASDGSSGPARQFGHNNDQELERFMRRFFPRHPGLRPMPHGGRRAQSLGSGFIISEDGYVVTNNHVIDNADEIIVVSNDGEEFEATLRGADPQTDIALLKIEADIALPYVRFGDSDAAREGDWVIAIGNPFGLGGTTSTGVISARGRDINSGPFDDYIQFDAPINRGNSGGPLFNTKGEVIGINTAIFSPNGGSVGIGFAVPSDLAQPLLAQLKTDGSISRGYLGVHIQAVDASLAESFDLEKPEGALVNKVIAGSPAANAGVEPGDIIVEFDGNPVTRVRDLPKLVAASEQSATVPVTLWRNGESLQIDVTVGAWQASESLAKSDSPESAPPAKLGVRLANIDAAVRQAYRLDEDASGVIIVDVLANSPAAKGGLQAGDIIIEINRKPAAQPADVVAAVGDSEKSVLLLVARNGQERFIAVPLA